MAPTHDISTRQGGEPISLALGQIHTFVLRRLLGHFIEVEDVHFNHDSAVLLADYRNTAATDDDAAADAQDDALDERITALAVFSAVYKHLQDHPTCKVLVTGHTDASGSDAYNLELSGKRAENVFALLRGEKDAWVDSCLDHHKVEDMQQLLLWMFDDHGWDTDPGVVDNVMGPNTRGAIERFKTTFNTEFGASIPVNQNFDRSAWEAFHDIYEAEILGIMGLTAGDLSSLRQAITVIDPGAVGCGENWPITGEHRSRVDRRVEIILFDPGEEPRTPLRCHPSPTECRKEECEFRNPRIYTMTPLPVEPVLAPRFRVDVHLQMVWKDPEGGEHPFPEGLAVKVSFGDGRPAVEEPIEADGRVHFIADKRSQSFTLGFEHGEAMFIASPPMGGTDPERLVPATDAAALVRDGWRIFRLPLVWNLDNCAWLVDAGTAPTYTAPDFTALDTLETIGTADAPCRVELLPHWQYVKLLYFDRKLKQKLSALPLVLEGFAQASASAGAPDTQSNWSTAAEACQALPWIRRKADDGSALNKPDADTLLQFRSKPGTFIDASGADRKLITKNPGALSEDPGLLEGVDHAMDPAVPGPERLAFYDLPEFWMSRTYFCRLSGGTGAPAAREGRYEDLAADPTTDAQPLLFSLDDIVLTGPDLAPLPWQPDATLANRFALFIHTFRGGPDLTTFGLYKPDGLTTTANRLAFFTQLPTAETGRNYIADYPDWTRLVVMGGNLFDCFDKRIADSGSGIVGARAGVRWVDATPSGVGVATGSAHPTSALVADASTHPFYAIQPFYQQEFFHRGVNSRTGSGTFDEWNSPIAVGEGQLAHVGRFDLALLRCCDEDNGDEIAISLRYHRYTFDYTAKASLLTPASAVEREQWADLFYADCAERWNGDETARGPSPPTVANLADGSRDADNTARTEILPRAVGVKLKIPILNFVQGLDAALSHFDIKTADEASTSFMNSSNGTGELRANAARPKTTRNFAGAHETGHAGGLPDEYGRRPDTAMGQVGFGSNHVPAAVFSGDQGAMMVFNRDLRARYLWHVAEWVRTITALSAHEFKLKHGAEDFELPHYQHLATRPKRNYVYWPVRAALRHAPGDPQLFDTYLFMVGADRFSTFRLVNSLQGAAAPGEPGGRVDGILGVVIKARFDMGGWTGSGNRPTLAAQAIARKFDRELNRRTLATFTVAANPDAPPEFKKCLLQFSLRFHSGGSNNEHIFTRVGAGGATNFNASAAPRELRVGLANAAPANPQTEFNRLADAFFERACQLLGLSADPAAANAYTQANAYRGIVRAVAGATVNPVITRRS